MTLQQLRYVDAIARERHFGKAARACGVQQSTLSMQVKKLEAEVGTPLFDRSALPLELTPAGQRVLQSARAMLLELDGLSAWMDDATERLDGALKLAVLPTIAPALLPRVLPALSQQLPQLDVQVLERSTATMVEGLLDGTIDMGILSTPLDAPGLRTLSLYMEPLHAYLHPEHPAAPIPSGQLHPDDLSLDMMLLLEEGHCFRAQSLQLCAPEERGCQLGFRCESGSMETLKRLVRQTGGCTLIPGLEAMASPEDPLIRDFAAPEPAREISLAVRPQFHRAALLHAMEGLLTEAVPEAYRHAPRFRRLSWQHVRTPSLPT